MTIGARPRLISSHSRTRGLDISARPIAAICCCAARQASCVAACRRSRSDRKQRVDRVERPWPRVVPAVAADQQVLLDGQRGKQPPPLRHQRDAELDDLGRAPARRSALPSSTHAVGACRNQAGDGFQKGRLAGPVGADDGDGLALVEARVDAVQRLEVAVESGEVAGLEATAWSRLDADVDLTHLGPIPSPRSADRPPRSCGRN